MKKLAAVLLTAAVLMVLMPACTASNPKQGGAAKYKDGAYTGEGDKRQYGYESASVTIKNGKMDAVVLKRLQPDGSEVNYDEWTGTAGADGQKKPNLKQYRVDLAKQMVEKQTYDVDAISGATDSSKGWKQAAQRALDKAVR